MPILVRLSPSASAREALPEIVNSHVLTPSALVDASPRPLQIGEMGAVELAGNDPGGVLLAGNG